MLKVAPGETKALPYIETRGGAWGAQGRWAIIYDGSDFAGESDPQGWNLSNSFEVTVPSDYTYYEIHTAVMHAEGFIEDEEDPLYGERLWTRACDFLVWCMSVTVSVTRASSEPVPGTSPQQYKHTYEAKATVNGGTPSYTYSWSTTTGSITAGPGTSSITIEVTNTSPNYGGVSGTVSCGVTDSDPIEPCTAGDSDTFEDSKDPGEPPCIIVTVGDDGNAAGDPGTEGTCGEKAQYCYQPNGNNPQGPTGNPNVPRPPLPPKPPVPPVPPVCPPYIATID
jgi:hypothetical protein